jgi:hypothetical protein
MAYFMRSFLNPRKKTNNNNNNNKVLAKCEVTPPKTNVRGKNGKVGVLEVVSLGGGD